LFPSFFSTSLQDEEIALIFKNPCLNKHQKNLTMQPSLLAHSSHSDAKRKKEMTINNVKNHMGKHSIVFIGTLLLISITLSGCTQPDPEREKFIGTWKTESKQNPMSGTNYTDIRTFYENGSYVTTTLGIGHIPGSWCLSNGKLIIDTYFPGSYQYQFSQNNNTLTLVADASGITENLTRQ
jgi:hypothetical protein